MSFSENDFDSSKGWAQAPSEGDTGPVWGATPQGQPGADPNSPYGWAPAAPDNSSNQSKTIWMILVAVIVVLILLLGFFAYKLFSQKSSGTEIASLSQSEVSSTNSSSSSSAAAYLKTLPSEAPAPKAGSANANQSSSGGGTPGYIAATYKTSVPFAANVAQTFASSARSGISDAGMVYSPVTGRSYWMTCGDEGQYYTCRGGDNAVVYILP